MPFAFATLRLHRVEAACIPENEPSRALLSKFGFRTIGLARNYLRIDGRWRDHILHDLELSDLSASRGMAGAQESRTRTPSAPPAEVPAMGQGVIVDRKI